MKWMIANALKHDTIYDNDEVMFHLRKYEQLFVIIIFLKSSLIINNAYISF